MTAKGPLTAEEKLQIVDALKKGNLSHRAIAQQFARAQSTISAIAKDSGIAPTHRRTRTPAAKDIEGSFGGRERTNLADIVLGVIRQTVKGGGLNPRELKDTTQALKLALEARRAEDFPEQVETKEKEKGEIYWPECFRDPDDPEIGIGFDPSTEIGREMIEFSKQIEEGRDPFAERWAKEKAQRERDRALEERGQDVDT